MESRLLDLKELCEYLSLGQASAKKVGAEAGAKINFGRRVLYDKKKVDLYIDSLSRIGPRPL